MRVADPLEHPFVVLEGAGPDAAGEDDDVGLGHLLEGGVGDEAEHAVLAAHLAAGVTDEGDVEGRDALEHLVGPDGVERREPLEQRDGDVHAVGHAEVLSVGAVRKRRR